MHELIQGAPVGRYRVHQLAVFDYMLEKEWMMYTYETNFKKSNGNKVKPIDPKPVDPKPIDPKP